MMMAAENSLARSSLDYSQVPWLWSHQSITILTNQDDLRRDAKRAYSQSQRTAKCQIL